MLSLLTFSRPVAASVNGRATRRYEPNLRDYNNTRLSSTFRENKLTDCEILSSYFQKTCSLT